LRAGGYSITAWLATNNYGATGASRVEPSTQVTLRPLDAVVLNADYPPNKRGAGNGIAALRGHSLNSVGQLL
jgi:hypothetical protein